MGFLPCNPNHAAVRQQSEKVSSVLWVDENHTLEAVLGVVLVGNHTPIAVTLNLCTDDANGSTKVLAAKHLCGSRLINGVAIAQVSRDALGLRCLRAVVLAVKGVLKHEATTKGGEGVGDVAHHDGCRTMIPIVSRVGAAGTGTGSGRIAHNKTSPRFRRVGLKSWLCRLP